MLQSYIIASCRRVFTNNSLLRWQILGLCHIASSQTHTWKEQFDEHVSFVLLVFCHSWSSSRGLWFTIRVKHIFKLYLLWPLWHYGGTHQMNFDELSNTIYDISGEKRNSCTLDVVINISTILQKKKNFLFKWILCAVWIQVLC